MSEKREYHIGYYRRLFDMHTTEMLEAVFADRNGEPLTEVQKELVQLASCLVRVEKAKMREWQKMVQKTGRM